MGKFVQNRNRLENDLHVLTNNLFDKSMSWRMKEDVEPLAAGALGIIAVSGQSELKPKWTEVHGTTVFTIEYNGLTNLEAAAEYYGMSRTRTEELFCRKYYDDRIPVEVEDVVFRGRMLLSFDDIGSTVAWTTLLKTHKQI
jgi:hypothetical protein